VTVCIASIFRWSYSTPGVPGVEWGSAALAVSDRMITAGDVQYEPQQFKVSRASPTTVVMIAGDYSLHTQALKEMFGQLKGATNPTPKNIALIYGRAIQGVKRRQAEDLFLAPLGLNTDSFIAQQKDMSEQFVNSITSQLQNYRGDEVEAIIVGHAEGSAQIYTVDTLGIVNCSDDVGFAAIGIGAWHAKSSLMQAGYINRSTFENAMAATFAAKKSAETAPGVGKNTDIHLITRETVHALWPNVAKKLGELYTEFEAERLSLSARSVEKLHAYMRGEAKDEFWGSIDEEDRRQLEELARKDKEANVGDATAAAEAPRGNEGGQEDGHEEPPERKS
jgi:hypothetical protein